MQLALEQGDPTLPLLKSVCSTSVICSLYGYSVEFVEANQFLMLGNSEDQKTRCIYKYAQIWFTILLKDKNHTALVE